MIQDNRQFFFELLRAGLWETDVRFSQLGNIDFKEVYLHAQEQSVVGLVAAGLEHIFDLKVPKKIALGFVGEALQLEERNKAMNAFVAEMIDNLRKKDIYTLLVKGQGIAQCYERPLWRAAGDVDLFLSQDNYDKAKQLLKPIASKVDKEDLKRQHLCMTIDNWVVELHGTLHCGYSSKVDVGLDKIRDSIFYGGQVRSWLNGTTQVFLPSADNDVIIIFSHIIQHFFDGGIGLRQVCDWCRLLWTFHSVIDVDILESRLQKMGLMTEWKAFATLAVNELGMPVESMLLFSPAKRWRVKADRVLALILDTGNFGQGRDYTYKEEHSFFIRLCISFGRHVKDVYKQFLIFPLDSLKALMMMLRQGLKFAISRD